MISSYRMLYIMLQSLDFFFLWKMEQRLSKENKTLVLKIWYFQILQMNIKYMVFKSIIYSPTWKRFLF